jgi:hypothetical protein
VSVSLNEISVVFLALPTGKQLVEDSHVQHSFAHRSPPRRPVSNAFVAHNPDTIMGGALELLWTARGKYLDAQSMMTRNL